MTNEGLTPMEAIVAATKTAAQCIGVDNKIGTLERGKLADLIILENNPITNIKILQDKSQIKMVMKDGKIYITRP